MIAALIADAKAKAEAGLSRVSFLDPSSRFFTEELFEAWDQIQTAAKLLDEARHQNQTQPFPQPDRNRRGKEPCGECHIQPGETCDICGASRPLAES